MKCDQNPVSVYDISTNRLHAQESILIQWGAVIITLQVTASRLHGDRISSEASLRLIYTCSSHTHTHHMYMPMHICIYVHTHTSLCICIRAHTYICVHISMYICIRVLMHTYIYDKYTCVSSSRLFFTKNYVLG